MPIDRDMEDELIAESREQRSAWAKLMPGVPLPRKKEKS